MKKTTRFLSTLLAVAMAVTIIPTSVFAKGTANDPVKPMPSTQVAAPENPSDTANYPSYDSKAPGFVHMEKSASWTDTTKTTADVTFNVSGKGVSTGVDAVVVFDRSGSMDYDIDVKCTGTYQHSKTIYTYECSNRWCLYEEESSDANLLGSECGSIFCSAKYTNKSEKRTHVCTECGDISESDGADLSGTPCTKTIEKKRLELAKESAKNFINTMFGNAAGGVNSENRIALVPFNDNVSNRNTIDFVKANSSQKLIDKIDGLKADDGTNYTEALGKAYDFIDKRDDKSRPAYVIFMTDGEPDPPKYDGKTEAKAIKDSGAKIYSIAFDLTDSKSVKLLKEIASDDDSEYFHAATANLNEVFEKIANNLKQAGTNAVITDYINDKFNIDLTKPITVTQNNKPVAGATSSVADDGRSVTVTFPQILSDEIIVTIPVILKDEYKNKDGIFYTNGANNETNETNLATITYDNFNDAKCTQLVKSPILAKPLGLIMYESILVDKNGSIGDIPFLARTILVAPKAFETTINGVPTSNLPVGSYEVTAPEVIEINEKTYQLQPKATGKYSNTYGKSSVNVNLPDDKAYSVYFAYSEVETANYTVEYYKDNLETGNKLPNATFTGGKVILPDGKITEADKTSMINQLAVLSPNGYIADEKANEIAMNTKVTVENNVIKLLCVKDDNWGKYVVEYYKDDTSGEPIAKITSMEDVHFTAIIASKDISLTESKPDGYQDGVIVSDTIVTKADNVIKVVYTKDAEQWGKYIVNYYQDSINGKLLKSITSTEEIYLPATIDTNKISKTESKPDGYQVGVIVNNDTTVTKTDNVIKVVYTKDDNWGKYVVEYYKDDTSGKLIAKITSKEDVHFAATIKPEDISKTESKPDGYKDGVIANNDTTVTKTDNVIKVVYTKDAEQWGKYIVNYYQDSINGKLLKSITSTEEIYLPATIDANKISLTESKPDGYQVGVIVGDTKVTKADNVIKVVYTKDAEQWGKYIVNYYQDSINGKLLKTITSTEEIYLPATIDATKISKTESKPDGYQDGVIVNNDTTVTKADNVIKVVYTAIPVAKINYTVTYYKQSDNEAGKTLIIKTTPIEVEKDTVVEISLTANKPSDGYDYIGTITSPATVTGTTNKVQITTNNQNIDVLYTVDPTIWSNYTVNSYTWDGKAATPINEGDNRNYKIQLAKIGSAVVINETAPETPVGYKFLGVYEKNSDGTSYDKVDSYTFTKTNEAFIVVFVADDANKAEYKVEYYVDGILVPTLTYGGTVIAASPVVENVKTKDAGGKYAAILGNCELDADASTKLPFTVSTDKLSTITMYYKSLTGDILPITHEYYLNGALQADITTTENKGTPESNGTLNTAAWQKPKDGYAYTGITIKGILKAMFDKPSENQTELEAMQAELKIMQEAVNSAKSASPIKNIDELINKYTALHNQLKALQNKPQTNEAPVVKDEAPVAPVVKDEAPVAPVVKDEAPVAPVVKDEALAAPAKEETPATTPTVEAPANEAPATTPTVEAPANEAPATTPTVEAPATPTDAEKIAAIENEMAGIKANDESLFTALDNLLNMKDMIAATPAPLALEAPAELPKEVTFESVEFPYDSHYNYTATLKYSKTQTIPDPTPDPEPPYIPPYNPPYDDTIIEEVEVPLAKPEEPDEIVEIVEEIPLGKLPKSGGLHSTALAGSGILALIASMLLKLRKKDED